MQLFQTTVQPYLSLQYQMGLLQVLERSTSELTAHLHVIPAIYRQQIQLTSITIVWHLL